MVLCYYDNIGCALFGIKSQMEVGVSNTKPDEWRPFVPLP